ncbi:hypothetical protein QUF70_21030, partial [Desulfobacterales bacterium HSG17]|nr:hypothetical protein [Desulfobacterales bacterium HSG17]
MTDNIEFKFECEHCPEPRQYNFNDLLEIIDLWGMICYITKEMDDAIIGLTCPYCMQTTIRNYKPDYVSSLLDALNNKLVRFDSVIPFSSKIIEHFGYINIPTIE